MSRNRAGEGAPDGDEREALATPEAQQELLAIVQAHQPAGHSTPTGAAAVRAGWAGVRRAHGSWPERKASARTADLRGMPVTLPRGPKT